MLASSSVGCIFEILRRKEGRKNKIIHDACSEHIQYLAINFIFSKSKYKIKESQFSEVKFLISYLLFTDGHYLKVQIQYSWYGVGAQGGKRPFPISENTLHKVFKSGINIYKRSLFLCKIVFLLNCCMRVV